MQRRGPTSVLLRLPLPLLLALLMGAGECRKLERGLLRPAQGARDSRDQGWEQCTHWGQTRDFTD